MLSSSGKNKDLFWAFSQINVAYLPSKKPQAIDLGFFLYDRCRSIPGLPTISVSF